MDPFHWLDGATVTASVTTSSSDNPLLKVPTGRTQLRFYNAGSVPVFVRKGSGGVAATATTADLPIAPGSIEVLSVVNSPSAPITSIGAITASGAATLYITTGAGI
jgi:FtsP/CotA-like multicopper oxidase with cupredoxin domain